MQEAVRRKTAAAVGTLFTIESFAFYALAAVHLGAPLGLDVQPRLSVATVAAVCGLALDGAAVAAVKQSDDAWQIGIAAHVLGVASVLLIDMVLSSAADGGALYRGFIGMLAVAGLLLMSTPVKDVLGHPEPHRKGRR